MREKQIIRTTKETDINLTLNLDGSGTYNGTCGVGFFDHMLSAFCVHAGFDLDLKMKGDLEVDCHHSIEDLGIVLGQAFAEAVGDKGSICRYGSFIFQWMRHLVFVPWISVDVHFWYLTQSLPIKV